MIEVLNSEPLWFQAAVLLGLIFGLRRSEIIGLQFSDIDWVSNTLTVKRTATQQTLERQNTVVIKPFTKNRRAKTFELSDQLRPLLHSLQNDQQAHQMQFGTSYDQTWNGFIMCYKDGKLISPNTLTRVFSRFIEKHNFKKIRFHDLRHSCASILYANGTDMMTIQEVLGHAQMTTTIMYTHKISDRKTAALAQMNDQFFSSDAVQREETKS